METRLFDTFIEVVRCGSFAGAARNLQQDPSSVSRAIAILEREVGVRLFQRTTRQLSLSEAGSQFLSRVEPIVAELAFAQEEVQSTNVCPRGRLCLSASIAFGQICVMPLLSDFLRQYPEIDLELKFTDRNVDFVSERIDLAIRLGPKIEVDVIGTRLMATRYRVCASPKYIAQSGRLETPDEMASHPAICFDLQGFKNCWFFKDSQGATTEVRIKPKLTISSALALREAALSGIGPTLLADWLINNDLCTGKLVDIFPEYEVTPTTFDTAAWLLYPSRSFLPRKTRVLIDFLRHSFRE